MSKQPRPVVLLRPVPGRTSVHELWAGTKLIAVTAVAIVLALFPGWVSIAMVAVFVLATARLARVPWGALPTVPRWLWILLFVGAAAAAAAGGAPYLMPGLGVGGLLDYLHLMFLAVVLLGLCSLVSWTTNVSDIAPAVSKLGRPFAALRIPVDDWAVTLALALRAFPMLFGEFRVLSAARRLRPRDVATTWWARRRRASVEVIDLLATAMTVALRRADEMGDAITARGGSGQISARPSRPTSADAVALAVVLAVCVLMLYVELDTPLATGA
ncbi:CbiQ family ECF transporter T component [Kibdelosporangium aridum]|uniref:CbiQ family ECF transporter T component n=1 Tax=Kibdelosporangium aridum TaxID=2030 RepID=UPI000A5B4C1A|nr:CbiQ family ECF transporter T component [Kibdelosporangium aridum]